MAAPTPTGDGSLPLRERKKLRTRRALADVALRMFTEKGFDATTVDELVDAVEVSKSTFFRTFATKEAVAIEAEVELWSAYVAALEAHTLSGLVLVELRDTLCRVVTELGPEWGERYVATRRLVLTAPSLLAYTAHHRAGVVQRINEQLTAELGLPSDDLRLQALAELAITGWSIAARAWVHTGGGSLQLLLTRVERAFEAITAGLDLSADA
ncbi:TetR family transcriptional regulator [Nonomuraea sp. NPDC047897]|uniref:TetR family transcriptional regulator n=1 Tax=Nonomuraea sp. NPDC047897 TaxID=3364346 RepID=UPI003713DF2A